MLIKRIGKKSNTLSFLGITPLVLRENKRVPLHILSCNSRSASSVKICVIQIKSEIDRAVQGRSFSILENAMRAINFEIESEKFVLSSPRAPAPIEGCNSDLVDLVKNIQPGAVLISNESITDHLFTNNRKKFGIGETSVLDDLDIPIIEITAPSILLGDYREKRRLWKKLVQLKAFLLESSL